MASNPYEVEHGIKPSAPRQTRRPDMSSFHSALHELLPEPSSSSSNRNVGPTPDALRSLFTLVLDQMTALRNQAPAGVDTELLQGLIEELVVDREHPDMKGFLTQDDLDALDRVPKKQLKQGELCPICTEAFLDDPYPLVVVLPCSDERIDPATGLTIHVKHEKHRFDLECVGPWLLSKGSCPMCRQDVNAEKKRKEIGNQERKKANAVDDEDEQDIVDGLYG
ncbi:uncharacterized protein BCR38DRAFT_486819 [Pseudomassariella vexata]|uniref:RING-type domain-containing protein n=1 Tax=Pseudomassariella vexata TaxID=1141098 RepID=A0A1Y2DTF7_9PEZI|nr:uncharacterized protein BCR38DRAFT_486819 [Pseudomassariella vexata]ORY62550.1 hypothetical protein BCR38DRAFT_486819 [Pseudomassariella vexata]